MYSNLISAGWLRVQQSYAAQLRQEVAQLLRKSLSAIKQIQCWPHQLWVVIEGVGARLFSYRCLPSWVNKVIEAIGRVGNFEQLKQLENILRCETQNHFYEPEAVEELRSAYRQKQEQLKSIKPQLEHEQKAQQWLESGQKMVSFCRDEESLEHVATAIEIQSQEFADLPEVIAQIRQIITQQLLLINSSS